MDYANILMLFTLYFVDCSQPLYGWILSHAELSDYIMWCMSILSQGNISSFFAIQLSREELEEDLKDNHTQAVVCS